MDELLSMFEAWWPMLGAGVAGVLLGILLSGRRSRKARADDAREHLPDAVPAEVAAPTDVSVHDAPAPQASEGAAPVDADPPAVPPSRPVVAPSAVAVAPLTIEALLAQGERGESMATPASRPFEMFERELNDWQQLARASAGTPGNVGAAPADESVDDWDDLMDIDGVDFDLARHLYTHGIQTFERVSASSPDELRAVLDRAGERYRSVDPSGWPASARRAIDQR